MSAVTTAAFRSMSDSRAPMVLARMPRWLSAHCRALFQITYPIALSELLWGTSTFVCIIVFTRIGTDALAASQIVTMIENIFIVAASGLAPAAVATVGQALGSDSLPHAQKEASLALRAGVISGLAFAVALIGGSLLLPMIYPRVGQDVLHLAFWGIVITAFVQPAKVLNSSLGTGILPSGGDTKFVLLSHVVSSYALGLPLAGLAGIALKVGPWSIFGARGLEEVLKAMMLFRRYRTASWHRKLET